MVGPDLEVNPDFIDVLLQSVSFDGYIQSKRDRPNCLSENGGLSCWVIDLTNCWTFVHCPQVLCGCHSGLKCHMLTISPLAKGHQLKQKEKVKCINVRVVDFDFRPWRCLVEFFTKFIDLRHMSNIFLRIPAFYCTYTNMRTALYALWVSCVLFSLDFGIRDESRSIFIVDPSFTWLFCFVCSPVVLVWLADDGWQWLPVGFSLCCVNFF